MLPANKKKSYKIKESEANFYHVLLIRKHHNAEMQRYDVDKSVQIFDGKGYEQFKKFMPKDISEVEILHDPTIKPVKP